MSSLGIKSPTFGVLTHSIPHPQAAAAAKVHSKPVSNTMRAGIKFPVGRLLTMLKKGKFAIRKGAGSSNAPDV